MTRPALIDWPLRLRRLRGTLQLVRLSTRISGGRLFWLVPLMPLLWPLILVVAQLLGDGRTFNEADAMRVIAVPLAVLAIALGARVIAGEIDRRTLEIAYTVPGGASRIWTAKLLSAAFWLGVAELPLMLVTWLFFTAVPLDAIYTAYQAAIVYLVLSLGLAAVTRSEVTGVLVTLVLLFINGLFTGFGDHQQRWSPFWNQAALLRLDRFDPADIQTWTIQNRLFMVLLVAALVALAYARAERREKMLSG